MKCKRLALSIPKTNFILFHSSKLKPNQSLRIKIDDSLINLIKFQIYKRNAQFEVSLKQSTIKQVDSTKHLGIIFDSNLQGKVILMSFV